MYEWKQRKSFSTSSDAASHAYRWRSLTFISPFTIHIECVKQAKTKHGLMIKSNHESTDYLAINMGA